MQEKKRWTKLKRWVGAGALSLTLLLGLVFPVHAAEEPSALPDISPWSISTLHEGEKYGIFPLEWYFDGTFKEPITDDKFQSLMDATEAELDLLGLKKKENSLSFETGKAISRENVIRSLYKLLANYELPEAFGITGVDPINYMQQKGIVKGTKAGLQLEQPSTVEQAVVMASRLVDYTYDTAEGGAKGLMWKVTNDKNTLYLLGSIHLGNTDMYPMHNRIQEAFEASDDLWVEVNIVTGDMSYLEEKMVYSDGTTLKDHVTAETYEKLQKVLAKLGLPANTFDTFKPFAVSNTLSTFDLGNQTDSNTAMLTGIDSYFITSAMLTGKPVRELESIKLQADLFADVPIEQQEKELNQLLDVLLTDTGAEEISKQLEQMQTEWIEGDLKGLQQMLSAEGEFAEGGMNDRLVGERDKNMANKLAELLEQEGENTSFIVVGAAHYALEGMVVDQLKEKGYTVEFIQ
ncbi:TraB/GumN family protein [Paenibacillus faecalis]|uniref:TraB/GumN family protein n=1 Tax=Paenibacillus faecalis TaxID=2079532 RepID=UPI000D106705|nr:TraB/GumN family protein [Paenibacillus faecalis]